MSYLSIKRTPERISFIFVKYLQFEIIARVPNIEDLKIGQCMALAKDVDHMQNVYFSKLGYA